MSEQKKSEYLRYLPAVFQEDPFLGRFLVPFEEVLNGFGDLLSDIDHYFTPALTEPDFLPWLAQWLAMTLDEEWEEEKRRLLIAEAVELYRRRGTVKGLERYLQIYAGLVPEIRECRWPGGMQIGVASRIGGFQGNQGSVPDDVSPAIISTIRRVQPLVSHDYYVVDEDFDLPDKYRQFYYRTGLVKRVETGTEADASGTEQPFVDIHLHAGGGPVRHSPARVSRRDGLAEDRYILKTENNNEIDYIGDTFLVDEEEQPYCFVVDVKISIEHVENVKLDKVRAIVNLEKPAHTMYYLKLTLVSSTFILRPMQIEIRSRIGVDTVIG